MINCVWFTQLTEVHTTSFIMQNASSIKKKNLSKLPKQKHFSTLVIRRVIDDDN